MDGESSRLISLECLKRITNNFSDEQVIGIGGFGTVYKGELPDGQVVAVKKKEESALEVAEMQFKKEGDVLAMLTHKNIVRLIGVCAEAGQVIGQLNGKDMVDMPTWLLCFEYMPNGNLYEYLSDASSRLDWDRRYKLIKGICCGLHYLHNLEPPVIHMDLKPQNILLDYTMEPKITDFGLCRLLTEGKTHTITANNTGTMGYMAREYINSRIISKESDIFSLGVIILEIVTGCRQYPSDTGLYSSKYMDFIVEVRIATTLRYTDPFITE
ncbi:hypothetical protein HU200_014478 [Digitaria exilis]|uniref:non-specific serine/threonine protein kinase n=1 Tax=Digitaria exilis TaxID=1010633 RepID=A0A835FCN5_9POAL|nr:hypothetical protein HU200_014478 [Digitaria exilis]